MLYYFKEMPLIKGIMTLKVYLERLQICLLGDQKVPGGQRCDLSSKRGLLGLGRGLGLGLGLGLTPRQGLGFIFTFNFPKI